MNIRGYSYSISVCWLRIFFFESSLCEVRHHKQSLIDEMVSCELVLVPTVITVCTDKLEIEIPFPQSRFRGY